MSLISHRSFRQIKRLAVDLMFLCSRVLKIMFHCHFSALQVIQTFLTSLMFFQAKPSRLHCSHCDETYSLPQNGAIKLYKELKCPLDEFELVLWTSGSRGKSYPLCPYCFSNPPFRDMKKGEMHTSSSAHAFSKNSPKNKSQNVDMTLRVWNTKIF